MKKIFLMLSMFTAANVFAASGFAATYEKNIATPSRQIPAEGVIFFDGFESGGFRFVVGEYSGPKKDPLWAQAQFQGDYAAKFVDSPVRSGKKAMRFEWRKANLSKSNTSKKAMIHYGKDPKVEGSERWYGFSFFLPKKDFPLEPKYNVVLFQMHATPDKRLKERYRIPMYALTLRKGYLASHLSYDLDKLSPHNKNIKANETLIKICPLPSLWDKWTDFVVHAKLSLKKKGLLQVWMNGKLVIDLKNINFGYNDDIGSYPSWGIYSYNGKDKRVMFVDEVCIGNEKANYYSVAPGKSDKTQKKMQVGIKK